MASSPPPLWSLPKPQRPPHGSWLTAILFFISFNAGIVLTNLLQLISLPLALFPTTYPTFLRILDFTKGTFGQLTIFISQRFAPTSFVVTAGHGMPEGDSWVERDGRGRVTGIKLPPTGIWMSNHQTLSDWLYIWSFAYFSSHHAAMLITLKASLKWIPFVGWACQLYGFVFLARRWASDKGPFKAQLEKVSERCRAGRGDGKLALLIFPEGTLVTGNTRPISAKFAAKLGVPDFEHTLLPRSTGLFFALRTLSRTLPTLALVDLTIAYPGTHLPYWPEDYYDLSIWSNSLPPPAIHVHLRSWNVRDEVPLGDLTSGSEGTEAERLVFEGWLRDRWREKDELMGQFLKVGAFPGRDEGGKVEWKLELRNWWESWEAFSYFIPAIVLYWLPTVVGSIVGLVRGEGGGEVVDAIAGNVLGAVVEATKCGCAKMAAASAAHLAGEL